MIKRLLPFVIVASLAGVSVPSAMAESPLLGGAHRSPAWRVSSHALPTDLTPGAGPGGSDFIELELSDVGAGRNVEYLPSELYNPHTEKFEKESVVVPVTVTDKLPPGVTYTGTSPKQFGEGELETWECKGSTVVTCTSTGVLEGSQPQVIDLEVSVSTKASGKLTNEVTAEGGTALFPVHTENQIEVGLTPAAFGLSAFEVWATDADGSADTDAGSHPYEATFSFNVNTIRELESQSGDHVKPAGSETESVTVSLPPGFIGDPQALPQCPRRQFDELRCPANTQVGVDDALLDDYGNIRFAIYNLVPPPGSPAQFAFNLLGIKTFLDAGVRSDGEYNITETVNDIAQRDIVFNQTVIWGVPSDPTHNDERCTAAGAESEFETCDLPGDGSETPFLTLPASCETPLSISIETQGWLGAAFHASENTLLNQYANPTGSLSECAHLSATPTITVAPDTSAADTPAGLTVEVKVPQEGLLNDNELSTADLKNTTVTLPPGVVINPGQAAGLTACQPSEDGVGSEAAPACPLSSKVGTVSIATPLLADKLEGNVYVLQSNPPNLQLLVAASADGVDLKLVGDVHLDEATGRLTTTFSNTPELPFTNFTLAFSGGAQAALATPSTCGNYATSSDFGFWSSPFSPDAFPESFFAIDRPAAGASSCIGPLPFSPSLTAGASTDQAGGYTDFSLLLQRADDQQRISTLSFKTPPGLLGMISKVPLCDEADANAGTCPASSQIGHTVIQSGPGPYPLVVPEPGQPPAPIYLTGGYKGAPYGLSIVVPLHVGPFVLQTQVVRASIAVDPHTAQLTVTTDPLPQIIDGIPTDLRTINAVIDREDFMFNPTNCSPQSFSGTASSAEGAGAPIASHFQVGSCQSLKFAPDFKVSTPGHTSRAGGAGLTAKIVYPTGALGANQASSQSNIAKVKVDLPKQLPSRLTTLQKACLAKVFEANPANCPKESKVGYATAITPVLPVPLNGPAYFVSHGGEAFPSLIVVLQGYGVTVDLVGTTNISKAGITSSTFNTVPDVPINSFELTLPEGKYSALATNLPEKDHGNLCGQTLNMPTAFVGQNGAEIHDTTAISISGCAKAKTLTRAQKFTKALKACRKKAKGKRAGCEKSARKDYGPVKKAKKK